MNVKTTRRYRIALVAIVAAALAVRLGAVARTGSVDAALESSYEHAEIAQNIAEGRGFSWTFFCPPGQSTPTSQQAPLVPSLLAGAYVLFGVESPSAIWCVWILQSLFSALTVLALAETTRHATARTLPALAAGAIACVYPPLVVSAAHLQALVWNLAFLSFVLWAAFLFRAGRTVTGSLVFIASSIGAWHADPVIGAVSASLLVFLALDAVLRIPCEEGARWRGGEGGRNKHRWRPLTLSVVVAIAIAIGLAPWTLRNYRVHGRWMAIKDSLPYVFWQGNTAVSHGTDKLCVSEQFIDEIQGAPGASTSVLAAQAARKKMLSVNQSLPAGFITYLQSLPREIDRMDAFGARIRAELLSNPRQYAEKCFLRLKQWLWFDQTNPRSYVWSYRASYLSLVALSIAGVWLGRRRLAPMAPLLVAAVALTFVHVLVITSARFRIPFELLLIPPAGVTTATALQGLVTGLARLRDQPAKAESKPFFA